MSQPKELPAVKQIIEQELALDVYLSTLLAEIPSTELIEEKEQEQAQVLKPVAKSLKNVVATVQKKNSVEVKQPVVAVTAMPVARVTKPLAVMPEYAQGEFSALFFKVGNLMLAAPLTDLLRTMKFDGKVTHIPQQPLWFMGLKVDKDKKVGVLNMTYLVQGKSRAKLRNYESEPLQNIIVTQDGNWGLACDEVLSIAKVQPDNVRWRTDRQKRPWLVGTVIDELVAIVDINELVPKRKRKS